MGLLCVTEPQYQIFLSESPDARPRTSEGRSRISLFGNSHLTFEAFISFILRFLTDFLLLPIFHKDHFVLE
jgi:hypothetical protein